MQPFMQQRPQMEPRTLVALGLKVLALAISVAAIILGALGTLAPNTTLVLLAVGLLALSIAAIMDTRVIIPRYLQQQPPPIPRPRRKKRR